MIDRDVALRLERAQYEGFAQMAGELARLEPSLQVHVSRPRGGCLFVMGRGWPVNRAYGVGLEGPVDDALIAAIEAVFEAAAVPPAFEICPLEHPSLAERLAARGYRRRGVMRLYAAAPRRMPPVPGVAVEPVDARHAATYETVVARGFAERDAGEPGLEMRIFARAAAHGDSMAWLARVGGEPAGGGALGITNGVAGLFGASTLPRFRRRGVQRALLSARMNAALDAGADLISVRTQSETGSERNVVRAGFALVHEQAIWERAAG